MINRILCVLSMVLAMVSKDNVCYIAAALYALAAAVEDK
jgi:hypothetical protein